MNNSFASFTNLGRLLSCFYLLFTALACRGDDKNPETDNSYSWGPVYLYNLCQVSSSWTVELLYEPNDWKQLSLSLAWDSSSLDVVTQEFFNIYSKEIESALSAYDYRKHLSFVQRQMNLARLQHLESHPYITEWLDAQIEGELSVIADKPLFGREPGTNLADCFTASAYICSLPNEDPNVLLTNTYYIVYSYPGYEVITAFSPERPAADLTKLFQIHTATIPRCIIKLKQIPEEYYDEITFSFSIALSGESILNYATIPISVPFENAIKKTLQGAITIHFLKKETG